VNGPKGIDFFIGDGTPSLAGESFIVIKASEGAGFPGPGAPELTWYPQEQARIRAMGALFGAFHFWHPSVDNGAQLANFKARATLQPGDLIQLDAEVTDGLAWSVVNARKNDMLGRLKAEFPYCRVLLYTYLDYWNHIDGHVADGLWIADPAAPPGQPRVPAWVFHQYGSGGVDYDIANFPDASALRAWAAGLIPAAPPQEPEMILTTGMNGTDVWALSGAAYWHVVDGPSVQGYRAAGVPIATIDLTEHQAILAATAATRSTVTLDAAAAAALGAAIKLPSTLTLSGSEDVTISGTGTLA
jgi:Glycosyl hydrolases family 25